MPTKPVAIFYSYSHKDEKYRDALSSSLALLRRQGFIKEWYDGNLVAGEKWEEKIYQQLDSADIVLMLVSRDFINSEFIWGNELKRALDRDAANRARVIPIILRPTDWQGSPIGVLQALPKNAKAITLWGNRDAAWLDVAKGLRKAIEDLQAGVKSKQVRTLTPVRTVVQKMPKVGLARTKRQVLETLTEHAVTGLNRTIFTAGNVATLDGEVARREGEPPTMDYAVNEAYEYIGATYDFFRQVFNRNSIDGKGMPLKVIVHYGQNFQTGFWTGGKIILGDGYGELVNRLTLSLEIIARYFALGVAENETELEYWQQSGALVDSLGHVFATMVKQYYHKQTVDMADWLYGDKALGRKFKGKAMFSLAKPGTAYDDPFFGKDPQPAHMRSYLKTQTDNGGVHTNSGIPNHAFYLIAMALGGYSWERAGKIWYETMLDNRLNPKAKFSDFAALTNDNAQRLFGERSAEVQAVQAAWKKVGVKIGKSK